MGKCLGLHFKIDLRINIRRVHRDMAQPSANRVEIHPRTQKVDRRCVTNRMWADIFSAQRWNPGACLKDASFNQREYAEAGDGLLPAVEEYGLAR